MTTAVLIALAAPAGAQDLSDPERRAEDAAAGDPSFGDDIVVLGTRGAGVDRTLSSDIATERMSQSSRSLERDLLTAAGTYRLSDALELVSGVSNQNNRGGFLDNFAIRAFSARPTAAPNIMSTGFSPTGGWPRPAIPPPQNGSRC